jgi:hypothetical protein
MPVDAEKEISRLWRALHSAQDSTIKTFYQWRNAAVGLLPNANPSEIALKGWEAMAHDLGKSYLPRLSFSKGEEAFLKQVAGLYVNTWQGYGAVVKVEKGSNPMEAFIKWERCPWPSFAKDFGAPLKEDVVGCDLVLQITLKMVNAFMGTNFKIETQKAIPRGEGVCLRRLYKP